MRVDVTSPTRIAREFNLRYHGNPITSQAVRKWLAGESIPSQEKIRFLALWLNVSAQWLRFGEADKDESRRGAVMKQESQAYDLGADALSRSFNLLDERHKKMILEIIYTLLKTEGKL